MQQPPGVARRQGLEVALRQLDPPGPDQVGERALDRRGRALRVAELDRAVELLDQLRKAGEGGLSTMPAGYQIRGPV